MSSERFHRGLPGEREERLAFLLHRANDGFKIETGDDQFPFSMTTKRRGNRRPLARTSN